MKYGKNIKLPKQFLYWCKKAGIKYRSYSWFRGKKRLITLRGHGCYWRINCHGHFQRSEPYEAFDRWANSLEATIEELPRNEKEFLAVVSLLKICSGNTTIKHLS